jgi:ribosome maturation factor RimP
VDGTTHHSREVKAVVKPTQKISVRAFPNPVSTKGTVRIATSKERELSVEVCDLLGRKVGQLFDGTVTSKQPEILNLNSSSLSSGTYFLRVHGDGQTKTTQITVVR